MRKILSLSLKKQILLIALIVALPAAAIILLTRIEQRDNDIEKAKRETQKLAAIISTEQTYRVAAAEQLLKILAQLPDVKNHKAAKVEPLLKDVLRENTQYSNIFICDPDGTVWASALPAAPSINVSDRLYFKKALASGRFSSGEYIISRFTKKEVFSFAFPFNNEKGRIGGVILVGFDLDYYKHLLSESDLTSGKSYMLLDYKGTILTRPINPKPFVGKPYNEQQFRRMQEGAESATVIEYGMDGRKRFISYRRLQLESEQAPYMYVRASIPVHAVKADATKTFATNLLLFSLFLIAALSFAWLIGKKSIADRVKLLESASRAMAGGNLEVRVADKVAGGELGRLGQAFDAMAHQLFLREQALSASEKRYRTLFNQSPDGVLLIDGNGTIVDFNDQTCRQLGYTRDEFNKLQISDIDPVESAGEIRERFEKTSRDGKGEFEVKHKTKSGTIRDVHVISQTVHLSGQIFHHAIWRDITKQKRTENRLRESIKRAEQMQEKLETLNKTLEEKVREETQKNQAKENMLQLQSRQAAMGEMINNIAHQWRQPLNNLGLTIQGLRSKFARGALTEDAIKATVKLSMALINHMSQTITDFTNFFQHDKSPSKFKMKDTVNKAVFFMETSLKRNAIETEIDIPDDVVVTGHRNEYTQVVINILSNARDVLLERQIQRRMIRLRAFRNNGASVLTIADNGGGIPEGIMDKLFVPYFTTKESGKGTGIGLYISKTIIENNMNGKLSVCNNEEGAEFRIEV